MLVPGAAARKVIRDAERNRIKSANEVIKGSTSTKVISNLGKEIDITPSSKHVTVSKNPGSKGTPNSSIDILEVYLLQLKTFKKTIIG